MTYFAMTYFAKAKYKNQVSK